LKGGVHVEALIFSILWVALAVAGWALLSWQAGLILSAGLFLLVMPTSALILTRTGSFDAERTARWGIFALAAVALLIAWRHSGG
jgi:hypothetical protein